MKITPKTNTTLYVEDLDTDLLDIESNSTVVIQHKDIPGRDRADQRLPIIRFRGNGRLSLFCLDNLVADHISLLGPDLVITSPRQSHFRTIQSSQCLKPVAVAIVCALPKGKDHNPDGPNNCRFDYTSVRNCTSPCLLAIFGGSGSQRQKARDLSFGQTLLHPTWEGSGVSEPEWTRTYLHIEHATGILMDLNRPTTSKAGDFGVYLEDVTNSSITSIVRGPGKQLLTPDASLTKNDLQWELKP